jgi:hypothetical protein
MTPKIGQFDAAPWAPHLPHLAPHPAVRETIGFVEFCRALPHLCLTLPHVGRRTASLAPPPFRVGQGGAAGMVRQLGS